jgi:hypothetical protein
MPKKGSTYEKRRALSADSRFLRPEVAVVEAFFRDPLYEEAVGAGDTELRDALLHVAYSRLIEEFEAAVKQIEDTTGFTRLSAARKIEDYRKRQELERRFGPDWHAKTAKADNDIAVRAGLKPAKRSAA